MRVEWRADAKGGNQFAPHLRGGGETRGSLFRMATLLNADPNERCIPANFFAYLSDAPDELGVLQTRESNTRLYGKAKVKLSVGL